MYVQQSKSPDKNATRPEGMFISPDKDWAHIQSLGPDGSHIFWNWWLNFLQLARFLTIYQNTRRSNSVYKGMASLSVCRQPHSWLILIERLLFYKRKIYFRDCSMWSHSFLVAELEKLAKTVQRGGSCWSCGAKGPLEPTSFRTPKIDGEVLKFRLIVYILQHKIQSYFFFKKIHLVSIL